MRGVGLAAAFAAFLLCFGVTCASADDEEDDDEAEAVGGGPNLQFFSGSDIWRNGGFTHGGVLWAYQGFNVDGPVLKLFLNGGLYRFRSNGREIVGRQSMGSVLPGWRGTVRDSS